VKIKKSTLKKIITEVIEEERDMSHLKKGDKVRYDGGLAKVIYTGTYAKDWDNIKGLLAKKKSESYINLLSKQISKSPNELIIVVNKRGNIAATPASNQLGTLTDI